MNVRRFLQDGAIWGWPMLDNPLTEARSRYVVAGTPSLVDSPWGKAISLGDAITLTSEEEFSLRFDGGAQDFSIVVWARRTAANFYVIRKLESAGDGWYFLVSSSNFFLGINFLFTDGGAQDTDWHCFIGTADRDGNLIVYLDGVPVGTPTALGGEVLATSIVPAIGVGGGGGDVAGIVVFDRVLTTAECLALAQPGRAF